MTKKPFRTFFRPISMNVHQQFFMEILARHQWEALYLWPFTDLVYLLEEETENIDPENFVKELVVTNPIILNTLRTTIKQETKKQFNKSISHSYTNKIFPLATKTELRQGGRKQSVQTLIKLIHSVEKYYDEHNGQRKETRANTIKEDPKKWTWQLYQELNQALRHPSAVHQKLFYQNYSTLENRSMTKKQSKNFHVDQYDVIKQLEILLLPAIEKTRQSQGAAQLKRNSKLKGNLQGNFKPTKQMAQASVQQIRNLLLRTSYLKKDSIEKHRVMRSKLMHSRMIQTLLSSPKNQQHILRENALNTSYKWDNSTLLRTFEKELVLREERDRVNETVHTLDQIRKQTLKRSPLKDLTYKNSIQKEGHEECTTMGSSKAFIKLENRLKTILERVSLKNLSTDRAESNLRTEKSFSTKGIKTQSEALKREVVERLRTIEIFNKRTLKQSHAQNLVYKATLEKEQLPVLENRLKTILERVSLHTRLNNKTESHLRTDKVVLTKAIKTQSEALNREVVERLRTIEASNLYTLKRSHMHNLVYRATLEKEILQKERFQKDIFQKENLQQESHQKEVTANQLADHLEKLPVMENRLKTILERVSLSTLSMNSTKSRLRTDKAVLTKAVKTQREALNQEVVEKLRTIEASNPYTLKRSHMHNLVYRATLEKEILQKERFQKDIFQKENLQQESHQKEVTADQLTVHLEKLPVMENRLKTILERVSLSTLSMNSTKSHLRTEKAVLTKALKTQREALNQEVVEELRTIESSNPYTLKRSRMHNLVYREDLKKESLQQESHQLKTSENHRLKERYYQNLTENILILTDHQRHKNPLQTEKYTKIIKTSILKGIDLNKILVQRKLLVDKVPLNSPSSDVPNLGTSLSDKAIEEIEVLKEKLAIAKEHERAELAHESRLITTSRNLITKNRQESEMRRSMKILQSQALQREKKQAIRSGKKQELIVQTEKGPWQPKKLSTKSLNIQQHDMPPLVQADSKLVSKMWIQEMIKVSSQEAQSSQKGYSSTEERSNLKEISSLEERSSLTERHLLTNKKNLTERASDFPSDGNKEGHMADKDNAFELDAEKIDLIADQVFRRVTDKIERERKRRGM